MVVGDKSRQKDSEGRYTKVLNANDPFDQLIMELGQKGVLNVCVVGIGQGSSVHAYSRRQISYRGKHTL